MIDFFDWISRPWHWAPAGVLLGLTVPTLLLIGNKRFGISSSLRHICAMCVPAKIPFFTYNWRKEQWNLYFVSGVALGGFLATFFLSNPDPIQISAATRADLLALGITDFNSLLPEQLFSLEHVLSLRGLFFLVLGGFLVGFGTRYAGGCTSGHSIMGIASLQWPSVVATCCFMIGGFFSTHLLLPWLLKLSLP